MAAESKTERLGRLVARIGKAVDGLVVRMGNDVDECLQEAVDALTEAASELGDAQRWHASVHTAIGVDPAACNAVADSACLPPGTFLSAPAARPAYYRCEAGPSVNTTSFGRIRELIAGLDAGAEGRQEDTSGEQTGETS